jgi:hypothetical protein
VDEILKGLLNEKQRKDYEQNRAFTLRGSDGRLYRLHLRSYAENNIADVTGCLLGAYHRTTDWAGDAEDMLIGQFLMLTTNADKVRMMACREHIGRFGLPLAEQVA